MPHSIFYSAPFAIHGTTDIARLGRPASHGCIRLSPADAAVLFELVGKEGTRNTTIVVQ
jgi:lipoprotein-anchoring transpeptidase ErfK/SrfK